MLSDDAMDSVLTGKPFVCRLSRFGLIKISGDDAETFLQGQLTCDISQVRQGHPKLGAHCNPKGRAQSSFVALWARDAFYLILPDDQIEPTLTALGKFAMFSKATLSASQDFDLLGLSVGENPDTLDEEAPPPDHSSDLSAGIRLHLSCGLQWILSLPDQTQTWLDQAAAKGISTFSGEGSDELWQLHLIQRGIAFVPGALSEQWIPQEMNYDLVDGISFSKGCYKGQEIVARIHYRGKTKVRTFLMEAKLPDGLGENPMSSVAAGEKISNESAAGTVLAAAPAGPAALHLLVVLKIDQSESQNLILDSNPDTSIRPLPLPYAIT